MTNRKRNLARNTCWLVLTIWGAFWTWFFLAHIATASGRGALYGIGMALMIVLLVVAALRWPAKGGYALCVAAVVGALFFRGVPSALALLVAPALLTGMVLAVVGR